MEMYSKELQELDRNTVQYMIDEMQETINRQDAQLAQLRKLLEEQNLQMQKLRTQTSQVE